MKLLQKRWFPLVLALLVVLAILVFPLWYEWRHPCVRTERRSDVCGGEMYCSMYDSNGFCMMWMTAETYPCSYDVCVERKP